MAMFAVSQAGVVMGLAWTAMGGTSLYIETSAVLPRVSLPPADPNTGATGQGDIVTRAGSGALRLTGQMGSVMQVRAVVILAV